MTTPGLDLPDAVWLNEAHPKKTLKIELGNLTEDHFQGRLKLTGLRHLVVECPGAERLALAPGSRTQLELTLRGTASSASGTEQLVATLRNQDGRQVVQRRMAVEWLGPLERTVLRGGSKCIRQEQLREFWRRTTPNLEWESLEAVSGDQSANDGGRAASYLWFHIPKELRNVKITNAQLRLHRNPGSELLLRCVRERSPAPDGPWGSLQRLAGPPWPDWNKVTIETLPDTQGATEEIRRDPSGLTTGAATIPGALTFTDAAPDLYLALAAPQAGSVAWWSERSPAPEKAPQLVIDYLPAPAAK